MEDRLQDRLALRELVERYFSAVDRRDASAFGKCFAVDARVSFYDGGLVLEGRSAISERLAALGTNLPSIHALASAVFDLEKSEGVVFGMAFLKTGDGDDGSILVRGLRYDDRYVVEEGQWRIQRREHHAIWQFDAAGVPPWVSLQGGG